MMFRFLKELFTSDNLLQQAFEATAEMLREDYRMFKESVNTLRHSDTAELQIDIFAADKRINKYEREVRRKVLTHLALTQPGDVSLGLVLISVVIDVERIGDYSKNIAELAQAHPMPLHGFKYEQRLSEVEAAVDKKFRSVAEAYSKSDKKLASKLMKEHKKVANWCDSVVTELITCPPDDILVGHAVVLTMYIRFLKRISSHLTNIVSSVVNPFPRIGYRYKGKSNK
jgi:phosphate transport system protein